VAIFNAALSAGDVAALATRSVAHFGGPSATNTVAVRVLAPEEAAGPDLGGGVGRRRVGADGERAVGADVYRRGVDEPARVDADARPPSPPALPFLWSDPEAPLLPRRFYRVRAEPLEEPPRLPGLRLLFSILRLVSTFGKVLHNSQQ
jgi:hypothetical protein